MKEVIQTIAQALVDAPEKVSVSIINSQSTSIVKLQVGDGDTGKIIGKQGKTANALRVLLRAIAAKDKKHVILEVVDDSNWPLKRVPTAVSTH